MELAEKIQRTGSLYESDPQEQLLKSFQKRNLDRFVTLLATGEVDINYYYNDPEHGAILDLCASQENSSPFLRAVMDHGAEPNTINRLKKKSPLHFIVDRNDIKCLSTFLEYPNVNVNVPDSFGNTPLHYAAKGQKTRSGETTALQILLNDHNINVNSINRKGQTPAHLAASSGNKDALLLLVRKEGIDLESSKDFFGKCALDLIKEKYDDILLPNQGQGSIPQTVTPEFVFSLLRARNFDLFKRALNENLDLINSTDGLFTLLQYSCDHGLYREADLLIYNGADVNKTNNTMQYTPLMLASRKGYQRIVQRLIKSEVDVSYSPINMENVYHCVVLGSIENSQLGDSDEDKDHLECLNVLLGHNSKWELINQGDSKGNTPLHYAGKVGNDEMVMKFLEAGAYAGCLNIFGDPSLSYIPPPIFEKYLDQCVKANDKLPREDNYEIIINYKCFVPPPISSNPDSNGLNRRARSSLSNCLNETDLLLYTSKSPDMKYLLMHPVLKSLIYMKWYNIRKWFYVNLLFYLLFWAFLSAYILGFYDAGDYVLHLQNRTNTDINNSNGDDSRGLIWYLVTFLLLLLVIRELFQFKKAYMLYLTNPENWLEVGLILLTVVILFVNVEEETKHQLSASAILISWTELVLLIGKHPALSTHIEMLKTVGWNFLKFLAWYSILIVAFALSFYTLFRNEKSDNDDNKVFMDPGVSVFKTIVMLTGEFEAGEIPFDRYPITGHLLFTLFVFAIAIVLYNLLNGLAVSDTQAIKSDAEMVGYVSRIKLVSYVETIDIFPCKNLLARLKVCNFSKDNFPDSLSCDKSIFSFMVNHEIRIFPNNRNRIEFPLAVSKRKRNIEEDPASCCLLEPCNCKDTVMDSTIVKSAQILLSRKIEASSSFAESKYSVYNDKLLDEFKKTLEEYKTVLRHLKETESRIQSLTEFTKH